jgi:AraC-like DNA-binding protein
MQDPYGKAFAWHDIEPASFHLDVDNPVVGMHAVHTDPDRSTFDMHYELELGIVVHGAMQRCYQTTRRAVGAGQAWLCGVWEPHGFTIGMCPCEVAVFVISPEYLRARHGASPAGLFNLFLCAQERRPQAADSRRSDIARIGRQLAAALAESADRRDAWLKALLDEVLLVLTEGWSPPGGAAADPGGASRLSPAMRLAFGEKRLVTEQEAAAACAMSRNTFARHFTATYGISFSRLALRHRLRGAAADLRNTGLPLKAIAAGWGFVDVSHFHRLFVAHYGATPARWRSGSRSLSRHFAS